MIAPETDAYAAIARFATPKRDRVISLSIALCAAAAAALVWSMARIAGEWRIGAAVAGAAMAGYYVVRALRIDRIEIDLGARLYTRTGGWAPFLRTEAVTLDDSSRLLYTSIQKAGAVSGLPETAYFAWVSSNERRLPLVTGWTDPKGTEYLNLFAERLGGTLELLLPQDLARSGRMNPAALAGWVGILGVFCLMLWPVLSGKKPIRTAWASMFDPGTSRAPAQIRLHNRGWSEYRQGKYKEAESLFAQAISAGYDRADGHNMLAYAQAGQGRLDEALKTAHIALSYDPGSGNILDTVGEMHELRKEYRLAEDYYRRALARITEPPVETRAKLGRTLLALGRRDEGLKHLRFAAQFPNEQSGYGRRAISILRGLGEEPPAHETLAPPQGRFGPLTAR